MEELTKVQVDWKKIAVVGFLVLLTGLVSAGATWYVGGMFHQAELEIKDNEIATLETRVEQLEAELAADEEEQEGATETDSTEDNTETEDETETETPSTPTNN